jgi:hypothetical protein
LKFSSNNLEPEGDRKVVFTKQPHPRAVQFHAGDTAVAVVNEAFAKRFFKGQNPIGQHFGPLKLKYPSTYEIVGVVRDMRYITYDYKEPVKPMYWLPEAHMVHWADLRHNATRRLLSEIHPTS